MDPVSIALGVGGIASSLYTNYTNQQNFSQQQKNWREQMDFAKYQYEDSKRFNSASAQVQRLRAAGINPALAFGQNAGQAVGQSQPGQGGLPTQTPLDMNGLSAIGQSINLTQAQKENLDANTDKTKAEASGVEIDNMYRDELNKSKIYDLNMGSLQKEALTDLANIDLDFQKRTLLHRIRQEDYKAQLMDAQVVAADIGNMYLPRQLAEDINVKVSTALMQVRTGQASLKQAAAAVSQAISYAKATNATYGATPEQMDEYRKAVLQQLMDSAAFAHESAKHLNFENRNPWLSRLIPAGATAAASALGGFLGSSGAAAAFSRSPVKIRGFGK